MLRLRFIGLIVGLLLPPVALASPPKVAVDIAPIHSLVTQVMEGVATPSILIKPEASPHSYSLSPSEARALSEADVVFWMSTELTPWLEKSLDTLASNADKIEMITVEGTTTYAFRAGATFEAHDHHDDEHHEEDANLFDKILSLFSSDHDHEEHEGKDPHAWLDPVNAKVWIEKIRDVLAKHDPDNAPKYTQNAEKAIDRLNTLIANIERKTENLDQLQFIVFHDAYQYFERRFGVLAAGSISLGDSQDPSPSRVAEVRDLVQELSITCIFSEPQFNAGLVRNVFEGTKVKNIGVMDPLGANIKAGKDQYEQLLNSMLISLEQCSR